MTNTETKAAITTELDRTARTLSETLDITTPGLADLSNLVATQPEPSAPPQTPLEDLTSSVRHHNANHGRKPDHVPVTLTVLKDGRLQLGSAQTTEVFTLNGSVLTGRGGSFNLAFAGHRAEAVCTVLPQASGGPGHTTLGLERGLVQLGFTLTYGDSLRWKYSCTVFPITATHEDGRVLWLTLSFEEGEHDCYSLSAGPNWLATFYNPQDQEGHSIFCMTDAELTTSGLPAIPPDAFNDVYGWRVRADALRLLVLDPNRRAVPGLVPADFFKGGRWREFPFPELRLTRAVVVEHEAYREKMRPKNLAPRQQDPPRSDEGDLPF